ncbi:MAG: dTMP kinase [Candidatus Latescibacteria bacterium]|nr:dTMP kinase [Candidatus Latescibacterota bacterium]
MFITFEGIDKSGKTTQARLLMDFLRQSGREALLTQQPGGSPLCAEIWGVIRNHRHFGQMAPLTELMLFAADRAQHVREVILPALGGRKAVVCDRYTDSTVAYQGYGRGLDLDIISRLNDTATEGLTPDLTFFIDIPVEEAFRRGLGRTADRMEMEQAAFYERVREGYLRIAASDPDRVAVFDGCEPMDRISEELRAVVSVRMKDGR